MTPSRSNQGGTITVASKTTGGCEATLNTLLCFTSGQLSWHHRSQAGRSQVNARMTASGHASDAGERATACGYAAPPSGQGKNAYADDETGSGQPTTTGHDTSGRRDRSRSQDRERSQRDREHPRQERERSEDRDRPQCERNTRREPRG